MPCTAAPAHGPGRGRRPRGGAARAVSMPVDDLPGAQQHRGRGALFPADHVGAVVHAVGEVDVEAARRAEHHVVARGPARGRRASPGSSGPAYASTSVIRTATPPHRRIAPSRAGATSSTGPARRDVRSAEALTTRGRRGSQLGELFADPIGGGTAPAVAGRDRALDGEHEPHLRGERGRDRGELLVGEPGELGALGPRPRARRRRRPRGRSGTACPRAPATRRRRSPARSPAVRARPSARC